MTDRVIELNIKPTMEKAFMDYAISVITDRALPDVRDGLKPVHRRILFTMFESGYFNEKKHVKCAAVVGEVLKLYHPHGDSSVYDALVRLAQNFTLLHPLVDGHGNFGTNDGDPAAAYRYTEARLSKIGHHFFEKINKDTVDMKPAYTGDRDEPTILPVTFPNILVNGTDGIAVGMATSVPTHNLNEVVDAFLAYIKNPDITIPEIIDIMPGPDFPTGGIVHGLDGYVQALETGRGIVRLRAEWHEEQRKGGASNLVITELPWRVGPSQIITKVAELVKDKKIDDISRIDDLGNKEGVRIVIELAKGASPEVVFNQLIGNTDLEISVPYNMQLLLGQQPMQMGIKEIFRHFLEFRFDVIQRATRFDLAAAEKRLHIIDGLMKAIDMMDETIATIRASRDAESARTALIKLLSIDQAQAQAILDLRLQKLTGMEMQALTKERDEIRLKVADLKDILAKRERQVAIIVEEAELVRNKYGKERQTTVAQELSTITREDLIAKEDVVVLTTAGGYVKRVPVSQLNQQNRGTRGKRWMDVGDDDAITSLMSASTHDYLLAFANTGQLHAAKVYEIPEAASGTKGRHVRNVLDGLEGEIISIMAVPAFDASHFLVTCSAQGTIKRTALDDYEGATRRGGIKGVKIDDGDTIVAADVVQEHDHVVLVSSGGKAIRFEMNNDQLRPMGRNSAGNRGIKLADGERVVGMIVLRGDGTPLPMMTVEVEREIDGKLKKVKEQVPDTRKLDYGRFLLCMGERGVGKKTSVEEFSPQSRGGKGVTCFNINGKTGPIVKALGVTADQDVVMTTKKGITNRIRVDAIRTSGRATAGTQLIKPDNGDVVVDVSPVVRAEEEAAE